MKNAAASPEVFVSYAGEDRARVRMLVEALRRQGIPVWWDQDILTGQNWENEIDKAIRRSQSVIVAWSQHSVDSDEVRGEADYARSQKKLIPVRLDDAELPFRYRLTQTLDLSQWTSGDADMAFQELLDDLRAHGGGTEMPPAVTRNAGTTKVNPKDGLAYVWIPPGTFQMGCSPGDTECYANEKPSHPVKITKGFWIGQTPVTVAAYKRYSKATGEPMPPEPKLEKRALNPGWRNEEQPIVNVTWHEAMAYCGWAGMRVPTEAEREYAARAGSREARYGDLDDIGWYADNSGRQRLDSTRIWKKDQQNYRKRLAENGNGPKAVGQKLPNAWKLHDMLGNVWEWTADWYGEKYYQANDGQDPLGPPGGKMRVLRGGSWDDDPRLLRVSLRYRLVPGGRIISGGFRCAGD